MYYHISLVRNSFLFQLSLQSGDHTKVIMTRIFQQFHFANLCSDHYQRQQGLFLHRTKHSSSPTGAHLRNSVQHYQQKLYILQPKYYPSVSLCKLSLHTEIRQCAERSLPGRIRQHSLQILSVSLWRWHHMLDLSKPYFCDGAWLEKQTTAINKFGQEKVCSAGKTFVCC